MNIRVFKWAMDVSVVMNAFVLMMHPIISAYGVLCSWEGNDVGICSLVPRPEKEEEEKGPGFSRSHMRLIILNSTTC